MQRNRQLERAAGFIFRWRRLWLVIGNSLLYAPPSGTRIVPERRDAMNYTIRNSFLKTAIAALLCTPAVYGGVVLDFESLHRTGSTYFFLPGSSYSEAGFTISALAAGNAPGGLLCSEADPGGGASSYWAGSTGLSACLDNGTSVLTKDGGGPFTLNSIQLAPFSLVDYGGNAAAIFSGLKMDSSVVQATFNAPMTMSFATFTFTGFDNLQSVAWGHVSPFHQYDNITLDGGAGTPEPYSGALLSLGLCGIISKTRMRRGKHS